METAATSNERTPLLTDATATNSPHQLLQANFIDEQTVIDIGHCSLDGNRTVANNRTSSEENDVISNRETSSSSNPESIIISCKTTSEERAIEVSLEEVVQALYSAWHRNRKREYEFKSDCLTTKDIYAMHLAWESVTRERQCPLHPHVIVEALASAIASELVPVQECDEQEKNADFHMKFTAMKNLLTNNLFEDWFAIYEGYGVFPQRYIETIFEDSTGQPRATSEFWRKQVELYDNARDFFLNPKLQILLQTSLFFWPLSILIIGSKYMECPIGHHLSHLLMILGCIGCSVILCRLRLMILTANAKLRSSHFWQWKWLRLVEISFLAVFIVQMYHLFDIQPITETGPNQCEKNFYNAALFINYVSIALVSAYLCVYSIVFCANQFDFWHWIIRKF